MRKQTAQGLVACYGRIGMQTQVGQGWKSKVVVDPSHALPRLGHAWWLPLVNGKMSECLTNKAQCDGHVQQTGLWQLSHLTLEFSKALP